MSQNMNSKIARRSRGQVLVLACLTFLLLAVTMMASFSISHAVHERIRIQSAADSHAFSIATLEARGFNTLGYMNRSIAGGIVATMGLHAWRAIALRDVSMYFAGFIAFLQVAALEFAQCPKFQIQHCIHGIQALRIAFKYKKEESNAKRDLESKDNQWKQSVKGFSDMIKTIVKDEKDLMKKVKTQISSTSPTLMMLDHKNAPQGSAEGFNSLNKSGLACAIEGSDFDGECQAPAWAKGVGTVSSFSKRNEIMESAAKAARPAFEVGRLSARNLSGSGYRKVPAMPDPIDLPIPAYNPQKMMDIQSEGTYVELGFTAQSLTLNNNKISSSVPIALVVVQWKHGVGVYFTRGNQSDSMGQYDGVCKDDSNCFVNFRMGKESSQGDDADFGQPATYGGMKQSLRTLKNGGKGNWEIDGKGSVQMPGTTGKFKYVSDDDAYAVAKGKTYFHQLGDNGWQVPPNFFDPFWRAKLQPFVRDELASVLQTAGDRDGSQIVGSGGPVEGVDQ